jgi:acyl carrier protein
VKDGIREYIISDLLDGQAVGDGDDLLLSGLVDSLGVMRLVTFLEDTFATTVPPEDVTIDNFANIDSIAAYIEGRLQ